jgi:two-component system sensor histidine kinase HydH
MKNTKQPNRFWSGLSPWVLIGAVVILLPTLGFMAVENINRQKENSMRLLLEKGAALIRSFEAGTRFGMMGHRREGFRLQQLLTVTAQQPDIAYLLVTDETGRIIAHSDPARIATFYGQNLDLAHIARSDTIQWRLQNNAAGQQIFEVFRMFAPTRRPPGRRSGPPPAGHEMPGHMMMRHWFSSPDQGTQSQAPLGLAIFVGLKMDAVEAARYADTRHTIVMATILLLVGFAGIVLLLMTQSYQTTRASLSRIKAFSANLVSHMPIGLLATDANGRIASINPAACSILALSATDAIGQDVGRIAPPALVRQIKASDRHRRKTEQEIACTLADGRVIPLEVNVSRLRDENETFLGHVLLFKDLREVRELRQAIERNQRLVTVGKLAGGVAHEIRNPLSSIKGFATYFKERYPDVAEDQKVAAIMIQEVERLNKVVGQLLEFSRPVQIKSRPTALKPFIQDSLKLVEKIASDQRVALKIEISSGPLQANFDPDRINQVLLNLYLNAIEAMPTGGTLTLTLTQADDREGLVIRIGDTGRGIDPEDLNHMFDPYYTTKASGTGLGLAIVHNIVEAHGGDIRVASQPGQGTQISIFLPHRETPSAS